MAARKLSRKQRRALAVGRAWNKTLSRRKRKLRAGKPKKAGWSTKRVDRRTMVVDSALTPIFGVRTRRKRRRKSAAAVSVATVGAVRVAAKRKRRKVAAAAPVKRRKAAKRKTAKRRQVQARVISSYPVLRLPKKASPRTITTPAPVYMDKQVAPPRSRGLMLAADNQLEADLRERRAFMAPLKGTVAATRPKRGGSRKKKTGTANPGRSPRMSWWIADVHIKNGKRSHTLCFIGKGTQEEAASNARKLMMQHKAASVELAGPYGKEPTPHAVRR